ncbi:unnamed protein product [Angiostrongylus costaricensis]|uniref:Peroxisomal membrane protein 11C n=1 Tax=Angiostrongylus costaricensis TaxID=334426 RepID=A0A0R3PYJ8_ANGCS|nr:unnamed protein product [Angiostrongylus costaricensis]
MAGNFFDSEVDSGEEALISITCRHFNRRVIRAAASNPFLSDACKSGADLSKKLKGPSWHTFFLFTIEMAKTLGDVQSVKVIQRNLKPDHFVMLSNLIGLDNGDDKRRSFLNRFVGVSIGAALSMRIPRWVTLYWQGGNRGVQLFWGAEYSCQRNRASNLAIVLWLETKAASLLQRTISYGLQKCQSQMSDEFLVLTGAVATWYIGKSSIFNLIWRISEFY